MGIDIRYRPPKTVKRFMRSGAFVRCIVGPIGSGKSSGCVLEIVRRAVQQKPSADKVRRTRFAIVRNTYSQLRDTTRRTFEQWIPPELGAWHEQSFTFRMRFPLKDGTRVECDVLFRALDRPQDVGKLLSLELTGCYFNELREIAKPIFDGMQGRVGRYPSRAQGGPTWFGVWADTNPWHTGHWAHKLFKSKPVGFELFRQPGGRSAEAENRENLPDGYYERLCVGKDSTWLRIYVDGEEATSDVGSIFGHLIDKLEARNGVLDFEHDNEGVFTNWDLGKADSTSIWFWKINSHGVADVIDFYTGHGRQLSHYFDVIESKPYSYVKQWLPHDAKADTLATQVTVFDQCVERFGAGAVAIGPQLSVEDGIGAARWLLEQPMRLHTRCTLPITNPEGGEENPGGLESLREYRFEWDEDAKCFSKRPLHNWASHPADAFRYLSCVVRFSELVTRKPKPPERPKSYARNLDSFTLEELYAMERNEPRGGGRI